MTKEGAALRKRRILNAAIPEKKRKATLAWRANYKSQKGDLGAPFDSLELQSRREGFFQLK
jgi:hypothetical protein